MERNFKIKTGSDFSGVGAFDQALLKLGIEQDKIFACDMDKYARETYIHNYGEPKYYPKDVYEREIPKEPLDIYITSPPCQSFSLAGKRGGESDKRGVLFYNSHEFIQKNKPRYFIFENVKGLLSDKKGRTFQIWCEKLGGKSINGTPVLFVDDDDAVPYHIYHKVLNAKHYGVPQNRERVFIIGIRDDSDNTFNWPKEFPLVKKLKDVLETEVSSIYDVSEKTLKRILKDTKSDSVLVNSATKSGYEIAKQGDSINLSNPNSETRRGRVGKEVAQTLDTSCNQAVFVVKEVRTEESKVKRRLTGTNDFRGKCIELREQSFSNTITTSLTLDHVIKTNFSFRNLTPRECFRLMDFPDSFEFPVSDTQAYKQAGNSIVVAVLSLIISKLKL